MPRKRQDSEIDIPKEQLESLARVLLPIIQEYLSSEQGQIDYADWTAKQQLNNNNKQKISH